MFHASCYRFVLDINRHCRQYCFELQHGWWRGCCNKAFYNACKIMRSYTRKFETSSKIQSISHLSHATQLFSKAQLTRIRIWNMIDCIANHRRMNYKNYQRNISHLHIFTIVCVDVVTPESLWRHKSVAMHLTHRTMHSFSIGLGSPPPASLTNFFTNNPCHNRSC